MIAFLISAVLYTVTFILNTFLGGNSVSFFCGYLVGLFIALINMYLLND